MHDFQEQCQVHGQQCQVRGQRSKNGFYNKKNKNGLYNKTIIRFGFCDIRNNQGLGQCYQPQPQASADKTYLDLDYSGYHKNLIQTSTLIIPDITKTSSNNFFQYCTIDT